MEFSICMILVQRNYHFKKNKTLPVSWIDVRPEPPNEIPAFPSQSFCIDHQFWIKN